MRVFLRVFVTILALAGAGSAGFAALFFQAAMEAAEGEVCKKLQVSSMDKALKMIEAGAAIQSMTPQQAQAFNLAMQGYLQLSWGVWFLYAAAGLGVFAVFLVLFTMGKSAGAVLLAAPIGPLVIMPLILLPLLALFTGLLPVAGLFAFFVSPAPPPSPPKPKAAAARDEDEEEDEDE